MCDSHNVYIMVVPPSTSCDCKLICSHKGGTVVVAVVAVVVVVKSNFISLQKVVHHCLKLYIVEILVPIEDGPVRILYDISAALYHFLLPFLTSY